MNASTPRSLCVLCGESFARKGIHLMLYSTMRHSASALLLLQVLGCARDSVERRRPDAGVPSRAVDSAPATPVVHDSASRPDSSAQGSHTRVQPTVLPAGIRATCDSAIVIVRQALALDIRREEGRYFDSSRDTQRVGCRLTGHGSFSALPKSSEPVGLVSEGFKQHGWRSDLRYEADGPDGSTMGLRRRDMLCLVAGRWIGGDEEEIDSLPRPLTEEENGFDAIVECAQDVSSNQETGVPDSIWHIASSAGLDSVYAISLYLQYPPYLDGDFDGDGVSDGAVLIENRASGKIGIAVVHRGTRRVTILGAGSAAAGPDDLSWINRWDVFRKEATLHLTIGDRPSGQLIADALWVGQGDSVSAFYVWNGKRYDWEPHTRK